MPKTYRQRKTWTESEDKILRGLVETHGTQNWYAVADGIPEREPKQCRERWLNHLDPSVNKDPLSDEEWKVLIQEQKRKGNCWSEIAEMLPGRTGIYLKNQWNCRRRKMQKKLDESTYNYKPAACSSVEQVNFQSAMFQRGFQIPTEIPKSLYPMVQHQEKNGFQMTPPTVVKEEQAVFYYPMQLPKTYPSGNYVVKVESPESSKVPNNLESAPDSPRRELTSFIPSQFQSGEETPTDSDELSKKRSREDDVVEDEFVKKRKTGECTSTGSPNNFLTLMAAAEFIKTRDDSLTV